MCHLFMKLPDMFDPNPMYRPTSDKIVAKHISVKEKSLTLSPKVEITGKIE